MSYVEHLSTKREGEGGKVFDVDGANVEKKRGEERALSRSWSAIKPRGRGEFEASGTQQER